MIIGKKILIRPVNADDIRDVRLRTIFTNRIPLHANKIPEFAVYIDEPAWNKFLQRAGDEYTQHKNEASGIFLGHYLTDQFGNFAVGTMFEAGSGISTSSVFCEISVNDQLRISQTAKDKNLLQIAWIHSHPTFGAFYSTVDCQTLKSMYYAPHQVGIVVDNVNGEHLGFKVKNGNVREFKDIYLITLGAKTPNLFRPFGKHPRNCFDPPKIKPLSVNQKANCQPASKFKGNVINSETEIIAMVSNIIDDLKKILMNSDNGFEQLTEHQKSWEIKIKDIETLLNEQLDDKSNQEMAPCFTKLNELHKLLKDEYSSANHMVILAKLNELSKIW